MTLFKLSLLEHGGPLMIPLIIISFIGAIISIERILYLHRDQIRAGEFLTGIKNLLRKRRLVEALTVCEETHGPVSNVVKAALLNYNQSESKMHSAIQAAALIEIPNLERRASAIATISKLAPLIGLLGTVLGIIKAFTLFHAEGPYTSSVTLSGAIAQSLITTAIGLTIATVGHLLHHFILGRIKTLVHDMEWVGHDIMQFLLRDLPEDDTPHEETLNTTINQYHT